MKKKLFIYFYVIKKVLIKKIMKFLLNLLNYEKVLEIDEKNADA